MLFFGQVEGIESVNLRNTLEQLVVLVCSVARGSDRCTIRRHDAERALLVGNESIWTEVGHPAPSALPSR